ncbi:hypothetical protein LC724_14770 [Blautia sp. RD014234]|nr:hypothetical protein [Blautia parvula]
MSKQVNYLEELKAEEKNLRLLQRTQGTAEQTELEHYMRNLVHKREDKGQLLSNLKEYYHFDIERDLKLMLIVPTLYMNQQPTEENFQAMSVKNVCMSMVDAQERGSPSPMMTEPLPLPGSRQRPGMWCWMPLRSCLIF